jgi:hypothetical protein
MPLQTLQFPVTPAAPQTELDQPYADGRKRLVRHKAQVQTRPASMPAIRYRSRIPGGEGCAYGNGGFPHLGKDDISKERCKN